MPEPVDRERRVADTQLAHRLGDLARPDRRLRRLVVVELPRVHRPDVLDHLLRPVHRVRVLEQDRAAFRRHQRASHERAHAVDRHRRRPRRVPDVRLVEQEARGHVVGAHRGLEASEPARAQGNEIDGRFHLGERTAQPRPRETAGRPSVTATTTIAACPLANAPRPDRRSPSSSRRRSTRARTATRGGSRSTAASSASPT